MLSGPFSESEIKDFSEPIDDGEFAEDYGYSSDSDLEEDSDFESPAPRKRQSKPQLQSEGPYAEYKEHVRMGKVIKIRDVAFITYVYQKSILALSQRVKVPSFLALSVHQRDQVRTVWIQRKSQVKEFFNRLDG